MDKTCLECIDSSGHLLVVSFFKVILDDLKKKLFLNLQSFFSNISLPNARVCTHAHTHTPPTFAEAEPQLE